VAVFGDAVMHERIVMHAEGSIAGSRQQELMPVSTVAEVHASSL
jgi:hypothetical protein